MVTEPRILNRTYRYGVAAALAAALVVVAITTAGPGNSASVADASSVTTSNSGQPAGAAPGAALAPTGAPSPGRNAGTNTEQGPAGTTGPAGTDPRTGTSATTHDGPQHQDLPPQSQVAGGDQGVSSTEIDLGAVYVPDNFYSQYGGNPPHEQDAIQAYAQMVNDEGGINGRRLKIIALPDNAMTDTTGGQAPCRQLINDDRVFMLLDSTLLGSPECAVAAHRPIVDLGNGIPYAVSQAQLDAAAPYWWITGETMDTQVLQWAQFLAHYQKAQDERIGLLYYSNVPQMVQAKNVFVQRARQYGLNVASTFGFTTDVSQAGLDCQQVVADWQQKRITETAFLAGPAAAGIFSQCISSSLPAEKYTFSAIGGIVWTNFASLYSPSFNGAQGVSEEQLPSSTDAPQRKCRAALAKYYPKNDYNQNSAQWCEIITVTATALRAIPPTTPVTPASFASAMASIRGLDVNDTAPVTFGVRDFVGSDSAVGLEYVGNNRYRQLTPFRRAF